MNDGRVVLKWAPPDLVVEAQAAPEPTEMEGHGNDVRLWTAWAYWTVRGGTRFTWCRSDGTEERVWMSQAEARHYLATKAHEGVELAQQCLRDLVRRGQVPGMFFPTANVEFHCEACLKAIATTQQDGVELLHGPRRYFGLCEKCDATTWGHNRLKESRKRNPIK